MKAYKAVGANGVVVAEPLTGLLSPDLAAEFSEPYMKQVIDAVQGRRVHSDLPQLRQQHD